MNKTIDQKLYSLVQISQQKLLTILERIVGFKDLIIDDCLMKPLERIVGASKLRSKGIDKMYKLNSDNLPLTNPERVFLINANLKTVKQVCDRINSELSSESKHSYNLILVTRKLCSIDALLEEEGLYDLVKTHVFQWELIPLDRRVLSLECTSLYKSLYIEGDYSLLHTVAKSIWTLQLLLGEPYITLVQGKYSEMVYDMVQVFNEKLAAPDTLDREVTHFLIIDRDVDYASTLLTGATYTSLLDEEFGINSGIVELKSSKGEKSIGQFLSNADSIYAQIKSRHFSDVFPFLSKVSKDLQIVQNESKTLELSELKRFISEEMSTITAVKKSLAYHISACEIIIEQMGHRFEGLKTTEANLINSTERKESFKYIEDSLIMNVYNRYAILRLICLLSITQDGLTEDEYKRFKTNYLHVYGYQYLPVFYKLEQANLCVEQSGSYLASRVAQAVVLPTRKSAFMSFAQKLKLIPPVSDDYDFKQPKDAGFVFTGNYIPVACQIVSMLAKGDSSEEDVAKLLPNCTIKGEKKIGKGSRTFVVYFVGGVTYAEISAFQVLEKLTGANIIVAGSSIINGNSIMKSFF